MNRRKYEHHIKQAIIARDGLICTYCGCTVKKGNAIAKKTDLTFDHITPFSQGGKETVCNLVVSCRSCNGARGNKDVIKFWYDSHKKLSLRSLATILSNLEQKDLCVPRNLKEKIRLLKMVGGFGLVA